MAEVGRLVKDYLNRLTVDETSSATLAQTPGPDLACQDSVMKSQAIHKQRNQLHILILSRQGRLACRDSVMESQAIISSESSSISTWRRARAGWDAKIR